MRTRKSGMDKGFLIGSLFGGWLVLGVWALSGMHTRCVVYFVCMLANLLWYLWERRRT